VYNTVYIVIIINIRYSKDTLNKGFPAVVKTKAEPRDYMTDTTNLPDQPNKPDIKDLSLESLSDLNWLFIKHYLETADIRKAYELAGYTGTEASAPYQVFKRLKPFIEEIGNLTVTSRIKLQADLSKALAIPLIPKDHLTVSEWIRVRKLAISLTPEAQTSQKLSILVVNRAKGTQDTISITTDKGQKPNSPPQDIDPSNIIDVEQSE
jgi:hypothetical protein